MGDLRVSSKDTVVLTEADLVPGERYFVAYYEDGTDYVTRSESEAWKIVESGVLVKEFVRSRDDD